MEYMGATNSMSCIRGSFRPTTRASKHRYPAVDKNIRHIDAVSHLIDKRDYSNRQLLCLDHSTNPLPFSAVGRCSANPHISPRLTPPGDGQCMNHLDQPTSKSTRFEINILQKPASPCSKSIEFARLSICART